MNGMETKKASPSKEKLLIGLFLNHIVHRSLGEGGLDAFLHRNTTSLNSHSCENFAVWTRL